MSDVHPIEHESMARLRSRVDLRAFGPLSRLVVERVIHASADTEFARTMQVDDSGVKVLVSALQRSAPVLCDVEMVASGITSVPALCYLGAARVAAHAASGDNDVTVGNGSADRSGAPTLSALGMRLAAQAHPEGAIVVIGCAPTALDEVLRLAALDMFRPAGVVGLPVGFVGAAEAKDALRASGLVSISNIGEKGGSAVASAAFNAIARIAGRHSGSGTSADGPCGTGLPGADRR